MPEKEATFYFRACESLLHILPALEKAGITIPPEHIAVVTDSITTLIHARSTVSHLFTNKLGFMTAKTQSILLNQGVSPMRGGYFFHQYLEPERVKFPADLTSKVDVNMSAAGMTKLHRDIHDVDWMRKHPSTWPISRGIVGKPDVTQTAGELGVANAALQRIQGEIMSHARIGGKVGQPPSDGEQQYQDHENRRADHLLSHEIRKMQTRQGDDPAARQRHNKPNTGPPDTSASNKDMEPQT